jgi:hypothetical protein
VCGFLFVAFVMLKGLTIFGGLKLDRNALSAALWRRLLACATIFVQVTKIGAYEDLYPLQYFHDDGWHLECVVKAVGRRDQGQGSDVLDLVAVSAP